MPITLHKDKIFPDDKIRVILKRLSDEDEVIEYNDEILHTVIYESKLKYPDLLKEFTFKLNGTYPYSELLERVTNRAKISRTIKTANPDFTEIRLRENVGTYIKSNIETKFSGEEIKDLSDIANQLKARLHNQ